jgi:hypothetical protein
MVLDIEYCDVEKIFVPLSKLRQDFKRTVSKIFISKCIFQNEHYVIFQVNNGNYYAMGNNFCGKLGLGDNRSFTGYREIIELNGLNIVDIVEGNACTFIITDQGQVYGWGDNSWGQLGIGETYVIKDVDKYFKPILVNFKGKDIKIISCGNHHNLALSSDNIIYGWGKNTLKAIDNSDELIIWMPKIIEIKLPKHSIINNVCAYGQTSYLGTTSSKLIYWGETSSSECCTEKSDSIKQQTLINCVEMFVRTNKYLYFIKNNKLRSRCMVEEDPNMVMKTYNDFENKCVKIYFVKYDAILVQDTEGYLHKLQDDNQTPTYTGHNNVNKYMIAEEKRTFNFTIARFIDKHMT